jgi:hypothetical protein
MTTGDVSSEVKDEASREDKRRLDRPGLLGVLSIACALIIIACALALWILPGWMYRHGWSIFALVLATARLSVLTCVVALLALGGLLLATAAIVLGRERKSRQGVRLGIAGILSIVAGSLLVGMASVLAQRASTGWIQDLMLGGGLR